MNASIDKAQVKILMGGYGAASATALNDPNIHNRVREYKRRLSGRMTALDKPGIKKKLPSETYHISRKIDGEFTVLVFGGEGIFTVNPGGTVRVGLPFMKEAEERLKEAGIGQALIAGELYYAREDGKRPRVHDIVRIARKPEDKKDLDLLRFAVFDILEIDSETPAGEFAGTWKRIVDIFSGGKLAHPVEAAEGNPGDVEKLFETWVEKQGEEGAVARSDAAGMFKIKPRHTLDVAVVGFTEGTEDREGMLHDVLVAVMRGEGTFQLLGRVGGGYTDEERTAFLSDLRDIEAESEYKEINSDRIAYRMVRPEWIFEISCLDLISESTRGGTVDRMVLNWNSKKTTWEIVRHMPLAGVISPQFVRRRDDKVATPSDIGIGQIADVADVPKADKNSLKITYPKSKILRRKVFVKEQKGATMVRKIVLWKTNKEAETDDFPAYVVYGTDFSPNRKTPLNRDIRVSNSQDQIEELWAVLEKKYFLKGWKPVDG